MKATAAQCIYARSVFESSSSASASTLFNDTKGLQAFTRQLVSLMKPSGRATDYEYSPIEIALTANAIGVNPKRLATKGRRS
jgi:hypothetical protein